MFLIAVFLVVAAAGLNKQSMNVRRLDQSANPAHPMSHFECSACISFINEALNDLIQIIAQVGIGGGCSKVCGLLPSSTLATICDIVCEIAGIEEFSKLLQEADPACPHSTTAAANITQLSISPSSGPQGTQFTISLQYTVTNTIATGELVVVIVPPDAESFGSGNTIFTQAPGQYGGQLQFTATPSEQEPFDAGSYQVVAAVCEGSCGSNHPWSSTLSEKQTSFTITSQKK